MQKAAVKRVAVIGSGAAGLQVAKSMVASGFDCIVLDKSPKVGGLWQSNYRSVSNV
jgi:cation diffusion facilitator CzcD-associated flavoprotein CzcO